jgi:hypothetical protein
MTALPVRTAFTRPLAPNEWFYELGSITVWNTFQFEGDIDLDALDRAWALLRREHPVLAGSFVPNQVELLPGVTGLDLVVPDEPPGTQIRVREKIDAAAAQRKIAPDEGRFGYRHTRDELSFVDVVPQGDHTIVSLAVSHALGDGRLNAHWNWRLWRHYTDLVEGRNPSVEPHPVPKPIHELLFERGHDTPPNPETNRLSKATPVPLEGPIRPVTRERIRLSRQETAKLRARARELGQSLNSLVLGAIALIERRWLPFSGDEPVDFNLRVAVDLRNRLEPAVPIWGGTNVLGGVDVVVPTRKDSDPVTIAAEALAQIQEDLRTDVAHRDFLRDRRGELASTRANVPRSTVTNLGEVAPLPLPSGLVATDHRRWPEQDWTPLLQLIGGKVPQSLDGSIHFVNSYDGRLSVEMGVPQLSDEARVRAEALEALLVDIAG